MLIWHRHSKFLSIKNIFSHLKVRIFLKVGGGLGYFFWFQLTKLDENLIWRSPFKWQTCELWLWRSILLSFFKLDYAWTELLRMIMMKTGRWYSRRTLILLLTGFVKNYQYDIECKTLSKKFSTTLQTIIN